jgi:hypothetical protein
MDEVGGDRRRKIASEGRQANGERREQPKEETAESGGALPSDFSLSQRISPSIISYASHTGYTLTRTLNTRNSNVSSQFIVFSIKSTLLEWCYHSNVRYPPVAHEDGALLHKLRASFIPNCRQGSCNNCSEHSQTWPMKSIVLYVYKRSRPSGMPALPTLARSAL